MSLQVDVSEQTVRLLSAVDLDQAMEAAACLALALTGAAAVAVLVWDPDLETFSDARSFGPSAGELEGFAGAFAGSYSDDDHRICQAIDPSRLGGDLPAGLLPLVLYRVVGDQGLIACLIMAGVHGADPAELEERAARYPLAKALWHAWEFRELKRENERLRKQYEHLEESMEEQTAKVIHDLTAKDSMYAKRESLVYSISNAVRSSLKIQEVLQTAVNQIGRALHVSRCLLLRPLNVEERLIAYEYHHPAEESVLELFFSEEGVAFLSTAMSRGSPQDLGDPSVDPQSIYDRRFLEKLKLRSGFIVPLILRDTNLGVIFLQDCQTVRNWSIDDSALIGALADLLCVAIENAELHEDKARQAVTDGLTGVSNRRHFSEVFYREFERARRYGQPLSLIVADLDFLKTINDTCGHQAGDEAIKALARVLNQGSRAVDLTARYGGEEFCLLLPNTELTMARQTAERLQKEINGVTVEGVGKISASIGVASFPEHASDPDALFQQADEALYEAKQGGRNCVRVARKAAPVKGHN